MPCLNLLPRITHEVAVERSPKAIDMQVLAHIAASSSSSYMRSVVHALCTLASFRDLDEGAVRPFVVDLGRHVVPGFVGVHGVMRSHILQLKQLTTRNLTQQAFVAALRGIPSQCVMLRPFWHAPGVPALLSGTSRPLVTIVFVSCVSAGGTCTGASLQREILSTYRQCVRQVRARGLAYIVLATVCVEVVRVWFQSRQTVVLLAVSCVPT